MIRRMDRSFKEKKRVYSLFLIHELTRKFQSNMCLALFLFPLIRELTTKLQEIVNLVPVLTTFTFRLTKGFKGIFV